MTKQQIKANIEKERLRLWGIAFRQHPYITAADAKIKEAEIELRLKYLKEALQRAPADHPAPQLPLFPIIKYPTLKAYKK